VPDIIKEQNSEKLESLTQEKSSIEIAQTVLSELDG